MARVTVEDCILQVPNRFELVMYAAQRARDISGGGQIMIDRDQHQRRIGAAIGGQHRRQGGAVEPPPDSSTMS